MAADDCRRIREVAALDGCGSEKEQLITPTCDVREPKTPFELRCDVARGFGPPAR